MRKIKLELTVLEARAIEDAIGNSLNSAEDAEALFGGMARPQDWIAAANRGWRRLQHLINETS